MLKKTLKFFMVVAIGWNLLFSAHAAEILPLEQWKGLVGPAVRLSQIVQGEQAWDELCQPIWQCNTRWRTDSTYLLVSRETLNSGGYDIRILSVTEREDKGDILVRYQEKDPPKDAVVIEMLTSPFHIWRIQKVTKPVVFRKIKDHAPN